MGQYQNENVTHLAIGSHYQKRLQKDKKSYNWGPRPSFFTSQEARQENRSRVFLTICRQALHLGVTAWMTCPGFLLAGVCFWVLFLSPLRWTLWRQGDTAVSVWELQFEQYYFLQLQEPYNRKDICMDSARWVSYALHRCISWKCQ